MTGPRAEPARGDGERWAAVHGSVGKRRRIKICEGQEKEKDEL
jgi:hypothetical protein